MLSHWHSTTVSLEIYPLYSIALDRTRQGVWHGNREVKKAVCTWANWPIHLDLIPVSIACKGYNITTATLPWMECSFITRLPPPAFHQASLTICWNPFLLLVERSAATVKCLVQKHNTMTQLGLEPETFNPSGIFENQASPGFRFLVDDWYPLVSDRVH